MIRIILDEENINYNDTKRVMTCFAEDPFPMFTTYQDLGVQTNSGRSISVTYEKPPSERRLYTSGRVGPGKCEM